MPKVKQVYFEAQKRIKVGPIPKIFTVKTQKIDF